MMRICAMGALGLGLGLGRGLALGKEPKGFRIGVRGRELFGTGAGAAFVGERKGEGRIGVLGAAGARGGAREGAGVRGLVSGTKLTRGDGGTLAAG